VCRIVRSNSEPRSNSPLTGNLLTSFSRARKVRSRIIHKNESDLAHSVNSNPLDLAVFSPPVDSAPKNKPRNFAPGSS
jgi:hypothetical protein